MTERLIEKIDRLADEAGIKRVTPEIRRFAMLVREDVVAQWPQREWVGLNNDDWIRIYNHADKSVGRGAELAEEILKEKNT